MVGSKANYTDGDELKEVNSISVPRTLHATEIIHRPDWFQGWEHRRPQWVQEVVGEFFGVFFYVRMVLYCSIYY